MRAQEVLKPVMLRRSKNATVVCRSILAHYTLTELRSRDSQEGEPILQLPAKDVELVFVEFSPDERDVSIQFKEPIVEVCIPNIIDRIAISSLREASADSDQPLHSEQHSAQEVRILSYPTKAEMTNLRRVT